jgi:nucleoside-diphosphate-sugar epimerase
LSIRNWPDLQSNQLAVLITGATGFIGRRLSLGLHDAGHKVRAVVRPERNPDRRVAAVCEQVPVDLSDADKLANAVSGCRAVVYCAGSVRGRTPEDFKTANISGVRAMLDAIESTERQPPLLLISSLAASRPELSAYAYSKHEAEQLLRARRGLSWSILRPPAVYGPGDKEMLPLLKAARRGLLLRPGPAGQRLSLLHVDDLAGAVLAWLAASANCRHKTYAIDDGRSGGYDWTAIGEAAHGGNFRTVAVPRKLLRLTARLNLLSSHLLGYQPMLTPGKARELVQPDWLGGDNAEFTAATGWRPGIDLQAGVERLFEHA